MSPRETRARRGRCAPSPTGQVHLGNASTALLAWWSVRAAGGAYVMRVEDIDSARSRPELVADNLEDLAWLGIDWDEGPDRPGPHAPYEQSCRLELYRQAFEQLRDAGRLYPCFCSRKDVAAAASAPQKPGEERRYPGTCRELDPAEARSSIDSGQRHAWRLRVPDDARPGFVDIVRGAQGEDRSRAPGDFVVSRSDGMFAYQLAVVVDDAAMGITEVVRGGDLLGSTLQQLLLYDALGLVAPRFGHVPLLLGPDGARLSKRHRGITLRELRDDGWPPDRVVGYLAHLLELRPAAQPLKAREIANGFDLSRVPASPRGIRVDLVRPA